MINTPLQQAIEKQEKKFDYDLGGIFYRMKENGLTKMGVIPAEHRQEVVSNFVKQFNRSSLNTILKAQIAAVEGMKKNNKGNSNILNKPFDALQELIDAQNDETLSKVITLLTNSIKE